MVSQIWDTIDVWMRKFKPIVTRNAVELADALGLSEVDAVEMQIRRRINDKIIAAVRESGLTHAQAAKSARTSRSRLTAVLNRNTAHVSTDLMLRILLAMGYRAKITFSRGTRAA
jgi:predicted XRE-type DNA-binding protein